MQESKFLLEGVEEPIINIESINSLEKKVTITVPSFEVDKKFQEFFQNVQKDVELPGFRKGKVPLIVLRQCFEEKAKNSIAQTLVNEAYIKATSQFDFIPIGEPRSAKTQNQEYFGEFNTDNSYTITLTLDVMPKIDPQGYTGIDIKLPPFDESTALLEKLKQYTIDFATHEEVFDEPCQIGDSLVIDFVGYINDEKFEGGTGENYSIESLGASNFIPNFEDQIVGMKSGESKIIEVTFPNDYRAQNLAAKPAKFEVKVHSIVKNTPANLDDTLANMAGFETFAALKDEALNQIKIEYENAKNMIAEHQIVKYLVDVNELEVHNNLVSKEFNRLVQQVGYDKVNNELIESLKINAINNVKAAFIVNSIYDKEKSLEISKDEFDQILRDYAIKLGKEASEVIDMLYKTNQLESFVSALKKNKVINFILSKANFV